MTFPKIELEIVKVTAKPRKLNATWTVVTTLDAMRKEYKKRSWHKYRIYFSSGFVPQEIDGNALYVGLVNEFSTEVGETRRFLDFGNKLFMEWISDTIQNCRLGWDEELRLRCLIFDTVEDKEKFLSWAILKYS